MAQTEWFRYKQDQTKESLGTPDGGVSIPALDALDAPGTLMAADYITDMRTAVEALAPSYKNPSSGNAYNWTASDADNLYFVSMGDRTDYGATGGSAYDWTRTKAQMEDTPTYDIDVGEVYECVEQLKISDLV